MSESLSLSMMRILVRAQEVYGQETHDLAIGDFKRQLVRGDPWPMVHYWEMRLGLRSGFVEQTGPDLVGMLLEVKG